MNDGTRASFSRSPSIGCGNGIAGLALHRISAHAMSPVGASASISQSGRVAAANILAATFGEQRASPDAPARVQERREWPAKITQAVASAGAESDSAADPERARRAEAAIARSAAQPNPAAAPPPRLRRRDRRAPEHIETPNSRDTK